MNLGYDKAIKANLLSSRKYWQEKAEAVYTDVWVTGKELTRLYPCFSASWLSKNGCYMYRTRAEIWDDDDNCQSTVWGYSLNFVKKKIEQGYIKCNYRKYYFNEDCTAFKKSLW